MAGTQTEQQVSLKLLINRETRTVLFAEAGKDFVDVVFSFLTLPLGTIARLVGKESNMQPVRVGCLSTLYESVANLDKECLRSEACKEMLLQPRNSMEAYCRKLKLNIDDTDPTMFFICQDWECSRRATGSLLSTFKNQRCHCGKLMNLEISPDYLTLHNGFVQETATLIVCDDLSVMPNQINTSVVLLQCHGIEDMDDIEEKTVNISKKEVVDLLKCSMLSKTPLTDVFLKKKQFLDNFNASYQCQFCIGEVPTDEGRQMDLKILVRKSNGKILFAEAEEDFTDFLFSFLTFPLGGVLHMLQGCSSLSCVDKLYKSIAKLSSDRYLGSKKLKDNLANPQCAPQFKLSNQILPIGAACSPIYYCTSYYRKADGSYYYYGSLDNLSCPGNAYAYKKVPLNLVDPKSCSGETSSPHGFAKGPSTYMVTDDLVVTPISSISFVSFLNKSKVPPSDLEERFISIGLKEGLSILKASLNSTSALTNGLNQFIKPSRRRIDDLFLSCLNIKPINFFAMFRMYNILNAIGLMLDENSNPSC